MTFYDVLTTRKASTDIVLHTIHSKFNGHQGGGYKRVIFVSKYLKMAKNVHLHSKYDHFTGSHRYPNNVKIVHIYIYVLDMDDDSTK